MELLPTSHAEFTSPEYWNSFFKKRGRKAFEWYGEYSHLCGILHKYVKPVDKVLMVGCGNSRLSEDMYDVGYHSIVNIDISDVVVRQMTERNAKTREEMSFEKMDVTQMTYEEGTFSVAVDKGTLDALAVDQEERTLATVNAMFNGVSRVLRLGGRYIIISLLQEQVLQALVRHFAETCWPIRIHRVDSEKAEGEDREEGDFALPVFAVVLTKFRPLPGLKQVVEVCSGQEDRQRLESTDQLLTTVKEIQYYALLRHRLAHSKPQSEQLQISLHSQLAASPRYRLWVVDSAQRCSNKFAIFIVPQGRDTEWMFSTEAGRRSLGESAGFQRLVVVALSREHEYSDMGAVQVELSSKVMELAPSTYRKGVQVPFLSIGEDIGRRTVRHTGCSQWSGDYVVEDLEGEGGYLFRRLIFMANQNVTQSEVRLVAPSQGKKKKKGRGKRVGGGEQVDQSYLACGHHHAMLVALTFLPPQVTEPRVVLVGLGGGPLAAFLSLHFPQVWLEVVEIDPEMSKVASDWFAFHHSDHVSVHIADGLHFIAELAERGEKRDVVMVDVDSKDASLGLSCPPPAFLTTPFLTTIAQVVEEGGVFALNFVCRDEALQKSIVSRIGDVFHSVMCIDVPKEVNRVIFAHKSAHQAAGRAPTPDMAKIPGAREESGGKAEGESAARATWGGSEGALLQVATQSARHLDRQMRCVSGSCQVDLADCVAGLQVLSVHQLPPTG